MKCYSRTGLGLLFFVVGCWLAPRLTVDSACSEQKASPTVVTLRAGRPEEPVRYVGKEEVLPYHDGGLRPAIGVKSFQAFRANRAHPELAEDYGWTYNHAPMLA